MAEMVDTAAPVAPADEAEKLQHGASAPVEEGREGAEEERQGAEEERQGAEEEREEAEDEREEPDGREKEAEEPEDQRSLTELFEQLGRDLTELAVSETQLEAARNMPEVRRAARDVASALVVVVAALTAFAFLNVAAMDGLSEVMATWLAALVLAAGWTIVGGVLLLSFKRARQWLLWIVLKAPPTEAVVELKRERDAAGKAALGTIERVGPALAIQIALAAMPKAGDVAGDMAGGVVEVGGTVLEVSDEIVDVVTDQLPGGGVVNQVWDVALMPGRLGIKVATTVLRRGKPPDRAVAGSTAPQRSSTQGRAGSR